MSQLGGAFKKEVTELQARDCPGAVRQPEVSPAPFTLHNSGHS